MTMKNMSEAFNLFEKGMTLVTEDDPNIEQSSKFR
jgi:hypothetical protein